MPLDKLKLAQSLTDLFQGAPAFPADTAEAGRKWAEIYRQFAATAQAGPTMPVTAVLQNAEPVLAKALAAAFDAAGAAGPVGGAAFLPLMDAAFVKFWSTPIPFAAPPAPAPPAVAGVVTPPAAGTLAALMTTALVAGLAPGASAAAQAVAIAAALDGWTKTVAVVNTSITPPGPAQPPAKLA